MTHEKEQGLKKIVPLGSFAVILATNVLSFGTTTKLYEIQIYFETKK